MAFISFFSLAKFWYSKSVICWCSKLFYLLNFDEFLLGKLDLHCFDFWWENNPFVFNFDTETSEGQKTTICLEESTIRICISCNSNNVNIPTNIYFIIFWFNLYWEWWKISNVNKLLIEIETRKSLYIKYIKLGARLTNRKSDSSDIFHEKQYSVGRDSLWH